MKESFNAKRLLEGEDDQSCGEKHSSSAMWQEETGMSC